MTQYSKFLLLSCACFISVQLFTSCGSDTWVPKPRSYSRIEFPERGMPQSFKRDCPYELQYPSYAQLVTDIESDSNRCWMNIHYPIFNASLHLSYKPILEENDLSYLLRDAFTFIDKHKEKASGIQEHIIDDGNTGGLFWKIGGNTASAIQFFVTDSTQHFLRGSLYFMSNPNRDSLNPVIDFLEEDILKTVGSVRWTDEAVD